MEKAIDKPLSQIEKMDQRVIQDDFEKKNRMRAYWLQQRDGQYPQNNLLLL